MSITRSQTAEKEEKKVLVSIWDRKNGIRIDTLRGRVKWRPEWIRMDSNEA